MFQVDTVKCTSPTCKICYTDGPTWFATNTGLKAYVKHQPSASELLSVQQIALRCPTNAITEQDNATRDFNPTPPYNPPSGGAFLIGKTTKIRSKHSK